MSETKLPKLCSYDIELLSARLVEYGGFKFPQHARTLLELKDLNDSSKRTWLLEVEVKFETNLPRLMALKIFGHVLNKEVSLDDSARVLFVFDSANYDSLEKLELSPISETLLLFVAKNSSDFLKLALQATAQRVQVVTGSEASKNRSATYAVGERHIPKETLREFAAKLDRDLRKRRNHTKEILPRVAEIYLREIEQAKELGVRANPQKKVAHELHMSPATAGRKIKAAKVEGLIREEKEGGF